MHQVRLTKKEAQILDLLERNAGELVSNYCSKTSGAIGKG